MSLEIQNSSSVSLLFFCDLSPLKKKKKQTTFLHLPSDVISCESAFILGDVCRDTNFTYWHLDFLKRFAP